VAVADRRAHLSQNLLDKVILGEALYIYLFFLKKNFLRFYLVIKYHHRKETGPEAFLETGMIPEDILLADYVKKSKLNVLLISTHQH
jgi:hypothetical protein